MHVTTEAALYKGRYTAMCYVSLQASLQGNMLPSGCSPVLHAFELGGCLLNSA